MVEVMQASIALVNLPWTVLLALIVLYWIFVILGALDVNLFDVDFDFESDADLDAGADADADVGADQPGGLLRWFFNLMNIGEVPVMVIFSAMILVGWTISMLANYYLNPGLSIIWGAALLIPNIIASLFVAGVITRPLRKIFSTFEKEETHEKILLRAGTVVTSEVTSSFGQLEIETKGAPLLINVRTTEGTVLKKGDKAVVYDEDKDKGIFFVEKFEE